MVNDKLCINHIVVEILFSELPDGVARVKSLHIEEATPIRGTTRRLPRKAFNDFAKVAIENFQNELPERIAQKPEDAIRAFRSTSKGKYLAHVETSRESTSATQATIIFAISKGDSNG